MTKRKNTRTPAITPAENKKKQILNMSMQCSTNINNNKVKLYAAEAYGGLEGRNVQIEAHHWNDKMQRAKEQLAVFSATHHRPPGFTIL